VPAADLCRRLGFASNTLYSWKAKYGRQAASEAIRLRELEDEIGRLKRIAAHIAS